LCCDCAQGLRSQHALIRDVACASLPKPAGGVTRAARADPLRAPRRSDELVGFHLEQAFRYARELGPRQARAPLAADASSGSALPVCTPGSGRHPRRGESSRRATALLPEADPFHSAPLRAGVALRGGANCAAEALLAGAGATATAGDRPAESSSARLQRASLHDPGGRAGEVLAAARKAIRCSAVG
jgi:hypothetical protein